MASEAVQPLRINKSNSPPKPSMTGTSGPLSEISPMGIRRNSPSFTQTTKKLSLNGGDSSPFEASPSNSSPRLFWKNRELNSPSKTDSENTPLKNVSPAPVRRSSIEKLKSASFVTNSNMFAREHERDYDPDKSSIVDRPLSTGRPLSTQVQGNAWSGTGLDGVRNQSPLRGHRRTESNTNIPALSPATLASPSKEPISPQKSSLSSTSRYASETAFDPDQGTWSDDDGSGSGTRANTPRATLRQPKSVSFDVAPPQINEYEMITPDPSSVASGSREGSCESDPFDMDEEYERDLSMDRDDSFDESLEDADKTPVVLPEDWRFMSPKAANTKLAKTFEDPFDEPEVTTSPAARYKATPERELGITRSDSNNSNGEQRPLPPVPSSPIANNKHALPKPQSSPPPPASISKADILNMRSSPMPLSERLRLLAIDQEKETKDQTEPEKTAQSYEDVSLETNDSSSTVDGTKAVAKPQGYQPPARVSRESILRTVQNKSFQDFEYQDSSSAHPGAADYDDIDYANLDPDVPIPSRENSSHYGFDEDSPVTVKQEETDDVNVLDLYPFPENVDNDRPVSPIDEHGVESSVIHHNISISECSEDELDESLHAEAIMHNSIAPQSPKMLLESVDLPTPKASAATRALESENVSSNSRMSLPELAFNKDEFGFGLQSFMTPSPPLEGYPAKEIVEVPKVPTGADFLGRPISPSQESRLLPSLIEDVRGQGRGTPDSVIHNPLEEESPLKESPAVPEPVATIKAPGSKLKTRLSATPADLGAMAAARRIASGEEPSEVSEVEEQQDLSQIDESILAEIEHSTVEDDPSKFGTTQEKQKVDIDVPLPAVGDELGFGLSEEFDRLLEVQKVECAPISYYAPLSSPRAKQLGAEFVPGQGFSTQQNITNRYIRWQKGYLMRQNTKVVVASTRQGSGESKASDTAVGEGAVAGATEPKRPGSRDTKSAGNSPRKPSSQTWTTEPWNGRMRRQSIRRSNVGPDGRLILGPAPPMPGQGSNVTDGLETVSEDQIASTTDELHDSGGERGRLFVKVVAVKDLDLPLPKDESCHFQMTLDNGLHCVTTSWAELGRTAPIGQEFELVVFDDLEFQLTLQTKLERPRSAASTNSAVSFTPSFERKKPSALSRMFTSPKKRREQERKQRDEEAQVALQKQQEIESQRAAEQQTAWDLQHQLIAPDGSFARAYVCLSNHEKQAYGRQYSVDVPCWNEWAVEDQGVSTRSKTGGVQRKPPYKIAKLELQLLFVPRPRNATDDDMPKSMSAAIRQLKDVETAFSRQFEGHLSQQGGDCPYWRRRFFRLDGSKLTAYHDMTRQPRATISLGKAAKLVDDRSSLQKAEPGSPAKKTGRRKSAFAADEEGYMFVEEGFRIRFANGEVIDFYADSREHKDEWMRVLSQVIGKEGPEEKKTWMSLVLAKESAAAARASTEQKKPQTQTKAETTTAKTGSRSTPASPKKDYLPPSVMKGRAAAGLPETKPAPIDKDARHFCPSGPTIGQTPSKLPQISPAKAAVSPSKRSSAVMTPASASPRKKGAAISAKRQGVRSMIF